MCKAASPGGVKGSQEPRGNAEAWKVMAEEVKVHAYNLGIKTPHTVADDHGDLEELLTALNAADAKASALRDQLKAILAEALAR
jgi:type I restriction enzyme M protein